MCYDCFCLGGGATQESARAVRPGSEQGGRVAGECSVVLPCQRCLCDAEILQNVFSATGPNPKIKGNGGEQSGIWKHP